MKVGIIGYAGSGKTALFNALTGSSGESKPGRISLREVKVPDDRVDQLTEMYDPQKTVYATIQLADLPGQAPGNGTGFDPQTLAKMREMELLVVVARAFENPFVEGAPDATAEVREMLAELLLSDLALVERRLDRLRREHSKGLELGLFERLNAQLESEAWLKDLDLSDFELEAISSYAFLTLKPVLVVVNTPEEAADEQSAAPLVELVEALGVSAFPISAKLEAEIAAFDPDEQQAFLEDLGVLSTARDRFIRKVYQKLNLVSFFTVGEDEVRAWTVTTGSSAQQAAGKIHTDLMKHFIRAERMTCDDLLELGSEVKVKEAGKFELKGKEYVVEDGDVLCIRANA